jgi:hypothetical protein
MTLDALLTVIALGIVAVYFVLAAATYRRQRDEAREIVLALLDRGEALADAAPADLRALSTYALWRTAAKNARRRMMTPPAEQRPPE